MRIVALEEHFTLASFRNRLLPEQPGRSRQSMPTVVRNVADRMTDLGAGRLADMDRAGISIQVLSKAGSHMGPSADMFDGDEAVAFAREFNDEAAREIAKHPGRFAAFAHLPMNTPSAAADELQRAVECLGCKGALISGTIGGAFLDNPRFAPLLSRAEQLGVPLYIHPGMPPAAVCKAYYDGLSPKIGFRLATFT